MRILSFRVHQRTAIPRPRKGSRRLLDDAPQVNSRWRPSRFLCQYAVIRFEISARSSGVLSRRLPLVDVLLDAACEDTAFWTAWVFSPPPAPVGRWCPLRVGLPPRARQGAQRPLKRTISPRTCSSNASISVRLAAMLSTTTSLIRSAMSFMGAQLMFVHTPCQSTATPCLSAGRSSAPAKRNRRPRDLDREHSRRRCHAASSPPDRTPSLSGAIRLRHSRTPASASALVRLPVPPPLGSAN